MFLLLASKLWLGIRHLNVRETVLLSPREELLSDLLPTAAQHMKGGWRRGSCVRRRKDGTFASEVPCALGNGQVKHREAQFKLLKALACRLAYPGDFLCNRFRCHTACLFAPGSKPMPTISAYRAARESMRLAVPPIYRGGY